MSPYRYEIRDNEAIVDSISVQAKNENEETDSIMHLRSTSLDRLETFEDDDDDNHNVEFHMYEDDEYITFSLKLGDSKDSARACRLLEAALLMMPRIYPTSIAPPDPFVMDVSPNGKRKNE